MNLVLINSLGWQQIAQRIYPFQRIYLVTLTLMRRRCLIRSGSTWSFRSHGDVEFNRKINIFYLCLYLFQIKASLIALRRLGKPPEERDHTIHIIQRRGMSQDPIRPKSNQCTIRR